MKEFRLPDEESILIIVTIIAAIIFPVCFLCTMIVDIVASALTQ